MFVNISILVRLFVTSFKAAAIRRPRSQGRPLHRPSRARRRPFRRGRGQGHEPRDLGSRGGASGHQHLRSLEHARAGKHHRPGVQLINPFWAVIYRQNRIWPYLSL
jgi:hypothetical protein